MLSATSGPQGWTVTVTGEDWLPTSYVDEFGISHSRPVTLTWFGQTETIDQSSFTRTKTVPVNADYGRYPTAAVAVSGGGDCRLYGRGEVRDHGPSR
jgi:hypothetical protein